MYFEVSRWQVVLKSCLPCSKNFELKVIPLTESVKSVRESDFTFSFVNFQTVFPILDSLDPNGYIMYRLVRDATDFIDGHHVKNLDCLNRDLKKVTLF